MTSENRPLLADPAPVAMSQVERQDVLTKPVPTKNSPLSEVEICRANGWGVGTLLVGDEGYGPTVLRITALGESKMLARRVSHNGRPVDAREGAFVLWCREWREVASERCS